MNRLLTPLALLAAIACAPYAGAAEPAPSSASASFVLSDGSARFEVHTFAPAAPAPAVPRPVEPATGESSLIESAPVGSPAPRVALRVATQTLPRVAAASEPFIPDVYPSQAQAARGLGELWAKRAVENGAEAPASIRIYCCDPALYASVVEGMRTRLAETRIEKAPPQQCPDGYSDGRPAPGEAWVRLDAAGDAAPPRADRTARAGRVAPVARPLRYADHRDNHRAHDGNSGGERGAAAVTLTLNSRGATDATASTRYSDVPWVANPGQWSGGGTRRYVVGRSDPLRPAMSEAEAAAAARRAAARELFPLVRARVPRNGPRGANDHWLAQRIEQELGRGRLVVDQFPQKFERPSFGGATWREAVLVDASHRAMDDLARSIINGRAAEKQSWLMTAASAAAVLLVTYTLYRLANGFTRGYFVWSLRTAAALVATAAVVLVRMIAG